MVCAIMQLIHEVSSVGYVGVLSYPPSFDFSDVFVNSSSELDAGLMSGWKRPSVGLQHAIVLFGTKRTCLDLNQLQLSPFRLASVFDLAVWRANRRL